MVPKRRVLGKERLAEVRGRLHPSCRANTSRRAHQSLGRRRRCDIPVPLLVLLVLDLQPFVLDLKVSHPFSAKSVKKHKIRQWSRPPYLGARDFSKNLMACRCYCTKLVRLFLKSMVKYIGKNTVISTL